MSRTIDNAHDKILICIIASLLIFIGGTYVGYNTARKELRDEAISRGFAKLVVNKVGTSVTGEFTSDISFVWNDTNNISNITQPSISK